jgi:hypothetical protein
MTEEQIQAWKKRVYKFVDEIPDLTIYDYEEARKFFASRGIDFAHVPKGWRFCKWAANKPQQLILWCGPGAVRDYLDAPSTLLAAMNRMESEIIQ